MASFYHFEDSTLQILTGVHNLTAAGNVVKIAIHSDAPTVGTDDELADLTQITGTGYTAGGEDIQNDISETAGDTTLTGVDVTWTGGAGGFTAGRYLAIHNDSSTTDKLLGGWDYGGNFTVAVSETFTADFGASVMLLSQV
jgi:expansin (peptidoglycan-binding protein)